MSLSKKRKISIQTKDWEKIDRIDTRILDDRNCAEICIHFKVKEEQVNGIFEQQKIMSNKEKFEAFFPIVEVSKLSIKDKFLTHEPTTVLEQDVKNSIINSINNGLADFRHPIIDPAVDCNGNIFFKKGIKPGIGNSVEFWTENVPKIIAIKHSRIGTLEQYYAYLGVIIKHLVEEKYYKISDAWYQVCGNSSKIGNYCEKIWEECEPKTTGHTKISTWYDLANCCKLVIDEKKVNQREILVGGSYITRGELEPLAFRSDMDNYSPMVAWIICDV